MMTQLTNMQRPGHVLGRARVLGCPGFRRSSAATANSSWPQTAAIGAFSTDFAAEKMTYPGIAAANPATPTGTKHAPRHLGTRST